MRLFRKEADEPERLFQLFASGLKLRKFDFKVFDKKQIKEHFGKGMYRMWEESLESLHYRKIIIIFDEKESKVSWPSNSYPDYLVINMARAPSKGDFLKSEEEMLALLKSEEVVA